MFRIWRSDQRGGKAQFLAYVFAAVMTALPVNAEMSADEIAKRYGSIAMHFEPASGGFIGRAASYSVRLTVAGAEIRLTGGPAARLAAVDASASVKPEAEGDRGGRSHYISGRDPKTWRTDVPHYDRVVYRNIYPGIDWVFYGNGRRLEYDFVLEPGADVGEIALEFSGVHSVELRDGKLVVDVADHDLDFLAPKAYQRIDGERIAVDVAYELANDGKLSFEVGTYSRAHQLVIDPVVDYATYLGGAGADIVSDIVVDDQGQAVVVGSTRSSNFPATADAEQETPGGGSCGGGLVAGACFDAFVAKLSSDGSRLLHATYFGGQGNDLAEAVAVNGDSIVVAGSTWARDFPTTPGALRTTPAGPNGADAFVLKLSSDGRLLYATLLGGSDAEEASGVAIDAQGNAYVTGHTESTDLPVVNAFQATSASAGAENSFDVFVAKLNPAGSNLVYATYLGGTLDERAADIAVDDAGRAYLAGSTGSPDFPTTPGAAQSAAGGQADAFLARLSPDGQSLEYSTRLGGSDADSAAALSVDPTSGVATLVGSTASMDFPVTPGVVVPSIAQPTGFAAKLNADGSNWVFSTYMVGTADDVALGASGSIYVSGTISSSSPIFGGPEVPACNGTVLRKLNATGSRLMFAGFQPGLGAIATGPAGALFSASTQPGGGLETTAGGFQTTAPGQADGYVFKVIDDGAEPVSVTCVSHGATFGAGPVAPGLIVSIFGSGLGPQLPAGLIVDGGVVTSFLADTRVLFDGAPAPLLYVHWNQINAVAPYSIAGKTSVLVQVERGGVLSAEFELPVGTANPGLFTRNGVGRGLAAILNEDGSINSIDNPAPKGSVVSFFGTGEGQTEPAGVDGLVTPSGVSLPRPVAPLTVELGSAIVPIEFAGSAPELVAGVMQINVRIPTSSESGLIPVRVTIGGRFTRTPLSVAVE